MSTPFRLQIPASFHEQILAQARTALPNECCGLLAGRFNIAAEGTVGLVSQRYPLINTSEEPTRRYRADEKGLFAAHRDMRQRGLELLAIYHSHPTSDPIPSKTDMAEAYWPGVMGMIISLKSGEPMVRAWWLSESDYREADWEVVGW